MLGMSFNPINGDYSRGATGFKIENGEMEGTMAGDYYIDGPNKAFDSIVIVPLRQSAQHASGHCQSQLWPLFSLDCRHGTVYVVHMGHPWGVANNANVFYRLTVWTCYTSYMKEELFAMITMKVAVHERTAVQR